MIRKLPEANIIQTIDGIWAKLPELRAMIPRSYRFTNRSGSFADDSPSLQKVEETLAISVILVILVVLLFLRSGYTMPIPTIAVPISLIDTFSSFSSVRLHFQ